MSEEADLLERCGFWWLRRVPLRFDAPAEWSYVGRYVSEQTARKAAKRRGWSIRFVERESKQRRRRWTLAKPRKGA